MAQQSSLDTLALPDSWVKLNVGGTLFLTSKTTLMKDPNSLFCRMLESDWMKDETGAFLIDRDPDYFAPILNYLRNGILILNEDVSEESILAEAKFFDILTLIQLLEEKIQNREKIKEEERAYKAFLPIEDELINIFKGIPRGWSYIDIVRTDSNYNNGFAERSIGFRLKPSYDDPWPINAANQHDHSNSQNDNP